MTIYKKEKQKFGMKKWIKFIKVVKQFSLRKNMCVWNWFLLLLKLNLKSFEWKRSIEIGSFCNDFTFICPMKWEIFSLIEHIPDVFSFFRQREKKSYFNKNLLFANQLNTKSSHEMLCISGCASTSRGDENRYTLYEIREVQSNNRLQLGYRSNIDKLIYCLIAYCLSQY